VNEPCGHKVSTHDSRRLRHHSLRLLPQRGRRGGVKLDALQGLKDLPAVRRARRIVGVQIGRNYPPALLHLVEQPSKQPAPSLGPLPLNRPGMSGDLTV